MSKFASMVVKNLTLPLNENPGTGASPIPAPPSGSLGERWFDAATNKSYMYVKVDTANNYATVTGAATIAATTTVATVNGAIAYWAGSPANNTVVSYLPYAQNATTVAYNANAVAGVFLGAVTSGNFTAIQTGGFHSAVQDSTTPLLDNIGIALVSTSTQPSGSLTSGAAPGVAHVLPGTAPAYRIVGYALGPEVASGIGGTIPAILVLDKDY